MKLLIAIVNNDDSAVVSSSLTREGFTVTKLSTTGGFLMVGNTTFLIGADDDKAARVREIIKKHSQRHTKQVDTTEALGRGLHEGDLQTEVQVGGAIVFTVNVEDVAKF